MQERGGSIALHGKAGLNHMTKMDEELATIRPILFNYSGALGLRFIYLVSLMFVLRLNRMISMRHYFF
jgi:hypothetical protein